VEQRRQRLHEAALERVGVDALHEHPIELDDLVTLPARPSKGPPAVSRTEDGDERPARGDRRGGAPVGGGFILMGDRRGQAPAARTRSFFVCSPRSTLAAMTHRRMMIYFAWSRPAETHAPLTEIADRFPALFELRRLSYPKFEPLHNGQVDQGISGFLDHVQKPNFARFAALAQEMTGSPAVQLERVLDNGTAQPLDWARIEPVDTLVVLSFDSVRTSQRASPAEVAAVRRFLDDPDRLAFVCPHHAIA
jgi:hypothetical protein